MPEEQPDLFEQFFDFLAQLLLPNWNDLFRLIPLVLILGIGLFFLYIARIWRRAAARNRPRLAGPTFGSPPPGVHLPGPARWPFVVPIGLALLFLALVLPARDEAGNVIFPFNVPLLVAGLAVAVVSVIGWLRDAMREWRRAEVGHAAEAPEAVAWAAAHGVPHAIDSGSATAVAALTAGGSAAVAVKEPPPGMHIPAPSPWPFFAPISIAVIFFGLILHPALVIGGLVLAVIAAAGWLLESAREYRSTEAVGHAVPATHDPVRVWPRRLVWVFGAVIALSIAVALVPLGLAWLGGLTPPDASPTPVAVPARPEISASSAVSFDRRELLVPAGRAFELVFNNNDPGVPHNVDIADSAARATLYLEGEIITGVASVTYQVPALAEGNYYFLCRVHPNMNGTVLARPETPGQPGGSPPPGSSPGPSASPGTPAPPIASPSAPAGQDTPVPSGQASPPAASP